jgi:hypothetical protein
MQTFKYYWPAMGWWCITLYLFTLPGTAFPSQNWMDELPFDKAAHLILFAIMVLLFYRGWRQQTLLLNWCSSNGYPIAVLKAWTLWRMPLAVCWVFFGAGVRGKSTGPVPDLW